MTKFRMFFNKDKETEWLNELAVRGYAMRSFFANFYTFDECTPGQYIYQIDFSPEFGHVHSAYREFMQETGVEIVCIWGFWVFLRKRAAEGPFELYSDVESTIDHYDKIRGLFRVCIILELICLLLEVVSAVFGSFQAGWGFSCLLLAVIAALTREYARLNGIIAELKSRRGEPDGRRQGDRPLTRALLIGILIGILVSILVGSMLPRNPLFEFLKYSRALIGVLLIGAGLALAVKRRQ